MKYIHLDKIMLFWISGGIILVITLYIFRRMFQKARVCGRDYPRDTIIVHQWFKGKYAPSLGHFVVKLETYLRMAKIPYEPYYSSTFDSGPKNKVPWIEYNGITMGDSQMIIQYLNKELNVDLNKHLSPKDKAIAWAIQKWLEEFTYWMNVHTKFLICPEEFLQTMFELPTFLNFAFVKQLLKLMVRKLTYTVGVGRHSDEEITKMMKHDLRVLSELLGDKKFFMGDEPCELDAAAFGQLAQYRWHTPKQCPGRQLLTGELTNLMDYTDRMKELYWPDWNERVVYADVD